MATDIAFVVGCLAVLGSRVPPALKIFMLSLAIIDDILAVIVIAAVFSSSIDVIWLGGAVAGLSVAFIFNKLGVRRIGIYVLVGAGVWLCTLKSGIHPTVAGVLLGLLTPARAWIQNSTLIEVIDRAVPQLRTAEDRSAEQRDAVETLSFAVTEAVSPLERLEHGLHSWIAFAIMPVFALANAGVPVSLQGVQQPIALAVIAGLAIGKPPLGIYGASWLAVKLKLAHMPDRTSWPAVLERRLARWHRLHDGVVRGVALAGGARPRDGEEREPRRVRTQPDRWDGGPRVGTATQPAAGS